jgi:hypothetical protein
VGSSPTLAHPATRRAQAAFHHLNPTLPGAGAVDRDGRGIVRTWEQLATLSERVIHAWIDENLPPATRRHAAITHRAEHAQVLAADRAADTRLAAEVAFDELNPEFGVPADTRDPLGHQAVADREAGLALGTRAAVALSRENDPAPVLSIPGQDYRAADATRLARQRRGPERAGPER